MTLVRTAPANQAVLATPPTAVRLVFDDTVRVGSGIKAIRNGAGSVLSGKAHVVGGRMLVVPLQGHLADGDYTVLWRVVSDDGHTIAGVTTFGVGAGRAPPAAALSVGNSPGAKDVVSRWLLFAGLLSAVGAAFFRFFVGQVPVRFLLGAYLLAFIGVSGLLHDVPAGSRFGGAMVGVAIVAGVGALLAAVAPVYPPLERVAFGLAFVLLPGPSIAGHALDRGRSPIEVVADLIHVAAASVWIGGLVALGLALRRGDRSLLLRRFSNVALASVAVLGITGVVRALAELDQVSQLWTTGYGRALIVKTALLAVLVGVGWLNRYRLVPRADVAGLRRSVSAELLLLAGLIVAVAFLTDLRPGRDRAEAATPVAIGPPPLPAKDMVVQAEEAGNLAVALAVKAPGEEVTVVGPQGAGVSGLSVSVNGVALGSCGSGCYIGFVRLRRVATVRVAGHTLRFDIPAHPRPAATLVARATRAFRTLRSVDYVERLASSPRNKIVSDFTLERPNRLEYVIRGGGSGIIVGTRRWDRARGGRWVPSEQSLTPQPEPIWAGEFTNAFLLETTPTTYVVSFMKPLGPTWFTLRLDRRTLRPRNLRMTTTSHFMTHRYTRFNAPPRIKAPAGVR